MSRRPLAGLLAACALCSACATAGGAQPSHVAVISVDGLGASELFSGQTCLAPGSTIGALAARGAYSRGVSSVLPAITYPAHATLSTGVDPVQHRVIDNGLRGIWFRNRSDIATDTLWDAARRARVSVAIVTWPSTYGAEVDYLVPEDLANERVATDDIRRGSTPGLFDDLVRASGPLPQLLPFAHPDAGAPLDEMTGRFAAEVVRRHKPRLLLTHFLDYDHRMHAGPYSADACRALARIDAWITLLVEAYREAGILERTTFFVVSDHGFLPVRQRVSVFGLLRDAGWDRLYPGREVTMSLHVKVAGGSVAFYPVEGMPPADAERMHVLLESTLRPQLERRHGAAMRWISQKRARGMGGFPGALFTLCAREGYTFAAIPPVPGQVYEPPGTALGMHGYCPDERAMNGVFIASGFRVRRSGRFGRMQMRDVAPTIAAFLDVGLPQAQGRDHSAAFRAR